MTLRRGQASEKGTLTRSGALLIGLLARFLARAEKPNETTEVRMVVDFAVSG
jgi:hypothetical protein